MKGGLTRPDRAERKPAFDDMVVAWLSDYLVEEPLVMADHQQRSRIVGKTSCQSHLGFQVKMVRRSSMTIS